MYRLFLTGFLVSFINLSFSQNLVSVSYDSNENGVYTIYALNNDYCNYVIKVEFDELQNLRPDCTIPYIKEIGPGRTNLFTLQPIRKEGMVSLGYKFSYMKGCIDPDVKLNFIYLLPVKDGNITEGFEITQNNLKEYDPDLLNWYSIGFKTNPGDTIYSARKGIVFGLKDTSNIQQTDNEYSSQEKFIEIAHDDCSYGRYQIFKKVLVKVGQTVEAGEPIGIAGGENYTIGSHLRFSVYYHNFVKTKNNKIQDLIAKWSFIPLKFHTKESKNAMLVFGEKYTSEHPDSLITLEMSKRELKKWKKAHIH